MCIEEDDSIISLLSFIKSSGFGVLSQYVCECVCMHKHDSVCVCVFYIQLHAATGTKMAQLIQVIYIEGICLIKLLFYVFSTFYLIHLIAHYYLLLYKMTEI